MNFPLAEIPQEERIAPAETVLACFDWIQPGPAWELVAWAAAWSESNKNWTRPRSWPTWIWVDYHDIDSSCVIYFLPFLSPLCCYALRFQASPLKLACRMHSRTQHSGPQVIKASLQQQTPIRKVAGNQLAAILMSTPFTFERLGLNVSTLDDCHLITVSFAPFLIWTKAELAERIAPVMGVASKCRLFNIIFWQRGYGRHVWMCWRKFATVK